MRVILLSLGLALGAQIGFAQQTQGQHFVLKSIGKVRTIYVAENANLLAQKCTVDQDQKNNDRYDELLLGISTFGLYWSQPLSVHHDECYAVLLEDMHGVNPDGTIVTGNILAVLPFDQNKARIVVAALQSLANKILPETILAITVDHFMFEKAQRNISSITFSPSDAQEIAMPTTFEITIEFKNAAIPPIEIPVSRRLEPRSRWPRQ